MSKIGEFVISSGSLVTCEVVPLPTAQSKFSYSCAVKEKSHDEPVPIGRFTEISIFGSKDAELTYDPISKMPKVEIEVSDSVICTRRPDDDSFVLCSRRSR